MAPPFKLAEFDILYGHGISRTGDLIDLAITHRLIDKSGAWFSYGETRLGQGRENVRQLLEQNADLRVELDQKLRRILGLIKEKKADAKDGDDAKAADPAKPADAARPAPARDAAAAKPAAAPARETPRPSRGPTPGARA
jgi:recombination protein RecA